MVPLILAIIAVLLFMNFRNASEVIMNPLSHGAPVQIPAVDGARVVLDQDLADFFGIETRALNQAVKRNIKRFPKDWAFQLNRARFNDLKSQSVISRDSWGGRRTPPLKKKTCPAINTSKAHSEYTLAVSQAVCDMAFYQQTGKENPVKILKEDIVMKKSILSAVGLALGLSIATPLLAQDQSGHGHGHAKPDCAAMKTMDHSKMDMNDPAMLAMMKKCMPAGHGKSGHMSKKHGHGHGHGGGSAKKHDHE